MRTLGLVIAALFSFTSCGGDPCEPKSGKTSCGYCAQDRAMTSNPHAGMCRYCGGDVVCSGDICTDALTCNSRVFFSMPGATFHPGTPPGGSGSSGTPVPTVTPTSGAWAMNDTMQWTVSWSVAVTITVVRFESTVLGGYFERAVTSDESNAGSFTLEMTETDAAPSTESCGGTTCWVEAPDITTNGEGLVRLVGSGGTGDPSDTLPLSWARPSYAQSTSNTGGGTGSTGCPTSGAQMGCCTTSGGIQIIGFGLSSSCRCPTSDTCEVHAGYCGCKACNGC